MRLYKVTIIIQGVVEEMKNYLEARISFHCGLVYLKKIYLDNGTT